MIKDEMKNEFLILSPSQSYDGSIMLNNNQKENSFQVGKRVNMSHPRQPFYEAEEDKTPAFEIFDLKANKQTKGWLFRNKMEQTNVKINVTEVNTTQQNQRKVQAFINKLKQHLTLKNKQHKIINQLLFSPLNSGKKIYKNSLQPLLNIIWNSILLFFCILLLVVSPIEYIFQSNGYLNYLYVTQIILTILDQIYKYTSQVYQEEQLKQSKLFIEYIFKSSKILMDTSSIVSLAVLILSDNEFIKAISLLIIEILIYKKIIIAFNKRLYYELSDLTIQIIQILLTCHVFTCINERQAFIINQEVKQSQEMFDEYLEIFIHYLLQFGNLQFNVKIDFIQDRIFNMCTIFILLFYKILILKLIILDSLDFYQEFKKIKDMKLLQRFLYKQKISPPLKLQISHKLDEICLKDSNQQNLETYFEQCLEKEQIFQEFKEQQLINFVNQFSVFSKFSKSTKQQIAQNLTPVILKANDKLICNQYGDQYNIYLLNQGKVAYGLSQSIPEYKKIFRGQCFGQYSFFTGQENKNLITGLDYCILYKLSRDKFLKIISSNVEDLEIASFIKDQILFNKNYQIIDTVCLYCHDQTHLIVNCPKIHLIKNNIGFYDKYLYSPNQPRKSYNKRRNRNFNQFQNHFKQLNEFRQNQISSEEISSEFKELSSSVIESNQEKNEIKFLGETQNNILNEINNDIRQIEQRDQQYQEIFSQSQSLQQQQRIQYMNIFDLKISNILNKAHSLKVIPSPQKNPNTLVKLQTLSLPTVTEFLNFINENPCMEDIYKVNIDKMQDFATYYPEFNISMVLFRMKRNQRKSQKQKSKITINQSAALIIGKIIQRSDKLVKM